MNIREQEKMEKNNKNLVTIRLRQREIMLMKLEYSTHKQHCEYSNKRCFVESWFYKRLAKHPNNTDKKISYSDCNTFRGKECLVMDILNSFYKSTVSVSLETKAIIDAYRSLPLEPIPMPE